jgi:hypothetical protein
VRLKSQIMQYCTCPKWRIVRSCAAELFELCSKCAINFIELCNYYAVNIYNRFTSSDRSSKILFPKLSMSEIKNNDFIFSSSKILNYLLGHDIPYHILPITTFKKRLKNHLLNIQNRSIPGDNNWLPCNHDIFLNIVVS